VNSPLLTDLYQLTMAYGYWKLNMHNRQSVFQLTFRKNPFKGDYAIVAGLENVLDFVKNWQFSSDDLAYLAALAAPNGQPLFVAEFLDYLSTLRITCDIDAIAEGSLVFPHEPLIRVRGPLLQGQLLESALLNMINFQTLIATKASRVCRAAQGEQVLEFGLRRAQGPDGALSASRAAYIGGCVATSNVLAGKHYQIPVRGTHAHSWVTAFADEMQAFAAYANVMPHYCVLLVDTYDTLTGVKNAIEIGKKLRGEGHELLGIRLDSGDLAELSIKARQMLDQAGFEKTQIVASNNLDEYVITDLKNKQARISIWGVGTSLSTAYDQPALDGVYKLSALQDVKGEWNYKLKLSEQAVKISTPGICQVRRFYKGQQLVMDVMYDIQAGLADSASMHLAQEPTQTMKVTDYDSYQDLLQPVFKAGQVLANTETIHDKRNRCLQQVNQFLAAPRQHPYPVGFDQELYELKQQIIAELALINDLKR
jgi:nicotinate phosphoribosyltransferase